MRDFDPYGKKGPKEPLPDVVKVLEPKVSSACACISGTVSGGKSVYSHNITVQL